MSSIRFNMNNRGWFITGVICLSMFVFRVEADTTFEQLVAPQLSTTPTGLEFYSDKNGALNLLYLNKKSQSPGNFEYLVYANDQWSSPIDTGALSQNKNDLAGVVNLSTGTPLMLIKGDDTDYGAMFGLSAPPPEPANETDPIVPGYTQAELVTLLDDNQRLFYSFFTNTSWSTPQLIPNTSRAANSVLAAGDQGGAVVIFTRDADKDSATTNDQELYYTVFYNYAWSNPVRITNNSVAEFNVRIIYTNGQYMAVWITDEDNDTATNNDWKYNYTTISPSGQLATPQSVLAQLQTEAIPILGSIQNQAVLLWQGDAVSETDPRRPILISNFNTSWSAPAPTGLFSFQAVNGKIYSTGAGELLVYYDSGTVQVALNVNNVWHTVGTLADIHRQGFDLSQLSHYLSSSNELWVALSAHIPAVGETEANDEAGDGIYVSRIPLSYDLAPAMISSSPPMKRIGEQTTVDIKIANIGQFSSPSYSVEIRQNSQVLVTLPGAALAPGQTQDFNHVLTQTQATIPLEVVVIADVNDTNPANNQLDYVVKVLPDFAVRSVKKQSDNQIVADIVERKGISAPVVPVDVYLIDGTGQNLIVSTVFDTNKAEPIIVESNLLVNKSGAYQILVRVNKSQAVQEDNYSNNQSAFNVKPAPDFVITRLEGDSDTIRVSIRNQGSSPVASVDLLLTDDPEQAVSSVLPVSPWFYQQNVILGDNGDANIEIQRSSQPALQGNTLYAVVNPTGQMSESDRNNNQAKLILATTVAPPPVTPPASSLELVSLTSWCQNLQVTLGNTGDVSIIAPSIEIFTETGFSVANRFIPVIYAGDNQEITFNGLAYGNYNVQVTYQDQAGQQGTLQGAVTLTETATCTTSTSQDLDLIDLALTNPVPASSDFVLRVTVTAAGYVTSYRKPLVRLPVRIEVKQGTTSYYINSPVLYVPADQLALAGHIIDVPIPKSVFPTGTTRVEVRILERNDENNSANNTQSIDVTAEAL